MPEAINVMEAIWAASEKAEDGSLHYPIELIDFLWDHGFVDTEQFSKETWRAAFEIFKQADETYKISHDAFLSLEKYRYTGPIRNPFDAMRINEGKYTDEGLDQLTRDSILPSCGVPSADLQKWMEALKKDFRQPDGLILIKADAKLKIRKFLEENPSPLRRLEFLFDSYLKKEGVETELAQTEQQVRRTATPDQQAAVQQSAFLSGEASFSEIQAKRLKEIAKAKPLTETAGGAAGASPGEPLKKVKRSKKGLRG